MLVLSAPDKIRQHAARARTVFSATASARYPLNIDHTVEGWAFRELGGPRNSLTRLLDPDTEDVEVAKDRLRRCVVVRSPNLLKRPQITLKVDAESTPTDTFLNEVNIGAHRVSGNH